jgi:3-dehydroquinate synthase
MTRTAHAEKSVETRIVPITLAEAAARDYDIAIGDGLLDQAGQLIAERLGARRCVIVTDTNVGPLYRQRCEAALARAGHKVLAGINVAAGEGSKNFPTLQVTLDQILKAGADRNTLLVALGGGVVGDLAGFAASIALRGMDVVQIPTTLVAQVDSSVGGKTGINAAHGKNVVGTFYQPRLVIADVGLLDTLPKREMLAGYAEVVKYGLIKDAPFFRWCEQNGMSLIKGARAAQIYAVSECCLHKARVVAADEREKGERALLNLGHTFGHALEAMLGYDDRLLHGEAVAIGTGMAFRLSAQLGLCPATDAYEVRDHLAAVGLPVKPAFVGAKDIDQLMQLMAQDKKAEAGKLTLILARRIGDAFVSRDTDAGAVREVWREFLAA